MRTLLEGYFIVLVNGSFRKNGLKALFKYGSAKALVTTMKHAVSAIYITKEFFYQAFIIELWAMQECVLIVILYFDAVRGRILNVNLLLQRGYTDVAEVHRI